MKFILFSLSFIVSFNAIAQSKLFLVGGAWRTCGSYSTSSCVDNATWSENAKTGKAYSVNKAKLEQIKSLKAWEEDEKTTKAALVSVLLNFHHINKDATFSSGDFKDLLEKIGINHDGKSTTGKKLFNGLPDHLYYPVNDILEAQQLISENQYRKEEASINNTKYEGSKAIYAAFLDAVENVTPKGKKPVVLVSTASGYDIFDASDFYVDAFNDLGVEAKWIPVEATFGKVLDEGQCKDLAANREDYVGVYNREQVYPYLAQYQAEFCKDPSKLVALAEQANGIFFNGGDQSLTWQSFVKPDNNDRPHLAVLRNKFEAGKLVISGTSAGTAVQSGAIGKKSAGMITGGTSDGAIVMGSEAKAPWVERVDPEANIRPVTYHPEGGLKFFQYGVLDTHFSERGRQLRLAKLVLDSDAKFGFGVDETTALMTKPIDDNNAEFEVVGQNGVYVVEQLSDNNGEEFRFKSHYLVTGQSFSLKDGKLQFPNEQFSPFKGNKSQLKSKEDVTQKTVFRDLIEKQLLEKNNESLASFKLHKQNIRVSNVLSNAQIAKATSMDGLHGYINAEVTVKKAP